MQKVNLLFITVENQVIQQISVEVGMEIKASNRMSKVGERRNDVVNKAENHISEPKQGENLLAQ